MTAENPAAALAKLRWAGKSKAERTKAARAAAQAISPAAARKRALKAWKTKRKKAAEAKKLAAVKPDAA